jgi:AcrR family transcriptional regulator
MKYLSKSTITLPEQNRSKIPTTRPYRKTARARSERATGEAILDAALKAFASEPFDRVTLSSVAEASGVTVQTVLRRFGSKEQLFETLVEREMPRILTARDLPGTADLHAALEALVRHYEVDGDLILNLLAQEQLFAQIRSVVDGGREVHRDWVERHCGDLLGSRQETERETVLHAAIAATDLSTWKLLRRDLGLGEAEVVATMTVLLNGLKQETARSS